MVFKLWLPFGFLQSAVCSLFYCFKETYCLLFQSDQTGAASTWRWR